MKRTAFTVAATLCYKLAAAVEPAAYVSTSVGFAEQKLSVEGIDIKKKDTAFLIAGGYRFARNVAIELGYTNFGTAEIAAKGLGASSKPQSVHLAVTGAWDASPVLAITGKLGAARTRTKLGASGPGYSETETRDRNGPMYGVGATYKFDTELAAVVEYQNFGKILKGDGADLKAHVVSVGFRYSY
jgi:OOP family OmpA-OmpF porin